MLGSVFIPERSERNYGIVGLVWTLNLRSYLHAGAFVFGRRSTGFLSTCSPAGQSAGEAAIYLSGREVVVDRSEIVKGYEFRKDEYIVIEPEEIKKIEPQTAKTMEILEFVKLAKWTRFFRVFVLHAAGEAGRRLCAADGSLEESEYVAIARSRCTTANTLCFLRHRGGLMLHTMYYEEEVRRWKLRRADVELKEAEIKSRTS